MKGFPCEDTSCEANQLGTCTAERGDGCEGYAIGDEGAEIDHEYTDEIVCPVCGHEFEDSWEVFISGTYSETKEQCPICGAKFKVTQDIQTTYSTELINEEQP